HTKMANQIAIAGTVSAVAEAIVYAKANGLDPEKLLGAISKGAAGSWQMSNNGVKMLQEDYNPGFFIKHFIKDMRLAKEAATAQNVELPVLDRVMYEQMQDAGERSGHPGHHQALRKIASFYLRMFPKVF
ncbi:MAG: NAD(P)-dependent oxidoreductase, partial [Holdemania filiformis]